MARSPTGNRDEFFLCIEGLPRTYTWQDLKDLIKPRASHGIWAVMDTPGGRHPSLTGIGYVRLSRADEAHDLFGWLANNIIENSNLKVHLWDTSNQTPRALRWNYTTEPPTMSGEHVLRRAQTFQWQPVSPDSRAYSTSAGPACSNPAASGASAARLLATNLHRLSQPTDSPLMHTGCNVQDQMRRQSYIASRVPIAPLSNQARPAPPASGQQPVARSYRAGSDLIPVNSENGVVPTEARGIYVRGINFGANEQQVYAVFAQVGEIVRFRLPRDGTTNKLKGNCTVKYKSAAEAREAIARFNNAEFMNRKLSVREDKDKDAVFELLSGPVAQPNRLSRAVAGGSGVPTIVNGSQRT